MRDFNESYTIRDFVDKNKWSNVYIGINNETKQNIILNMLINIDGNEGKIQYSNKELSSLIHMPEATISNCNRSLEAKGYLEGASEFIKRFPQDKLNLIFIEKFKEQDERMDNIEDEVRMLREELARLKKERELGRNINTQMIL